MQVPAKIAVMSWGTERTVKLANVSILWAGNKVDDVVIFFSYKTHATEKGNQTCLQTYGAAPRLSDFNRGAKNIR